MADEQRRTGTLGLILGGIVVLAAAVVLVTGGDLGGTKSIEGDHDLPPVTSPPRK